MECGKEKGNIVLTVVKPVGQLSVCKQLPAANNISQLGHRLLWIFASSSIEIPVEYTAGIKVSPSVPIASSLANRIDAENLMYGYPSTRRRIKE